MTMSGNRTANGLKITGKSCINHRRVSGCNITVFSSFEPAMTHTPAAAARANLNWNWLFVVRRK